MLTRRSFLGALAAIVAAPRLLVARAAAAPPAAVVVPEVGQPPVFCESCGAPNAKPHLVHPPHAGVACIADDYAGYEPVYAPSYREATLCGPCLMLQTGTPITSLANLEAKLNRWTVPRGYRLDLTKAQERSLILCCVTSIDAPHWQHVFSVKAGATAISGEARARYVVRQIKYETIKAMEKLDAQRGPAFVREYSRW